jgi:hypothetical protein
MGLMRIPRSVVYASLSVVVILVVLVGGGLLYTWLMGQTPPPEPPAVEGVQEVKRNPLPEPRKPDPNAPVGVAVQSLTSPVLPGTNVSLIVRTTAEADCTIIVKYDETEVKDSGLVPKKADEYGMVSWTWTVDEAAPLGTWPVDVTCAYGEKSGMVRGDLVVKKSLED